MTPRLYPLLCSLVLLVGCAPPAGGASSSHPAAPASPPASTPATVQSTLAFSGHLEQRREPSLPQPREELAAAVLDGALFVIGGFDVNGRDTSSVLRYDGSWAAGPPLPEALDHPAAAVLLGQLYVAGGFSAGRARAGVYRLASDHWERAAPLRHPRAAFALIALDGRLYALGGRNSAMSGVAPTEVYDPASDSWSDLPDLPAARHHLAGFAYQGMACVAGGKFPYTARVDCLDPASSSWRRLPDLPQATSGAGAAVLGGRPVVMGGEGDALVAWLFVLMDGGWQRQAMLLPRHGSWAAMLGDRAWLCGGGAAPGLRPTSLCTSMAPGP